MKHLHFLILLILIFSCKPITTKTDEYQDFKFQWITNGIIRIEYDSKTGLYNSESRTVKFKFTKSEIDSLKRLYPKNFNVYIKITDFPDRKKIYYTNYRLNYTNQKSATKCDTIDIDRVNKTPKVLQYYILFRKFRNKKFEYRQKFPEEFETL